MKPVYVCKNPHEKAMQRALIQYRNPKNYDLVKEALLKAGREDLIGFDKKCLIRPRNIQANVNFNNSVKSKGNSQGRNAMKDNSQKNFSRKENAEKGRSNKKNTSGAREKQGQKAKKTIRNVHKKK